MDLEFDDHQIELRDAARELLAKECPPATVRAVIDGTGDEPADRLWKVLGSLDWPLLTIPEAHGGMGMGQVELAIVCEELGYVADPTPFVATTSQFVPVVAHCGDEAQRSRFLGEVAAGGTGTLAVADASGRWDPASPPVRATRTAGGWRLDGTACFVVDGDRADRIAVLAAADDGPVAVVVPAGAAEVRRTPSFDATLHLAEVCVDGVEVDDDACLRGGPGDGARAVEEATTAMALVVVGACQRALDLVLAYVREREQFGVPIGSFQAVKGKAVDMYVVIERARALGWFAALTAAEDDARRSLAASMASAAASEAQRLVFQHAIQLFGGIGFTWENDLHLYLRRAKAASLLFGTAEEHRARIGSDALAARGAAHAGGGPA